MASVVTIAQADKRHDADDAIAWHRAWAALIDRVAQERMPRARPPPVALSPAAARARRSPPFLGGDGPKVAPRRNYTGRGVRKGNSCCGSCGAGSGAGAGAPWAGSRRTGSMRRAQWQANSSEPSLHTTATCEGGDWSQDCVRRQADAGDRETSGVSCPDSPWHCRGDYARPIAKSPGPATWRTHYHQGSLSTTRRTGDREAAE